MSKSHLALLIAIAASASCSAALRDDVPLDGKSGGSTKKIGRIHWVLLLFCNFAV